MSVQDTNIGPTLVAAQISFAATGGGAATNCTLTTNAGVVSVNYNSSTGFYVVTLSNAFNDLIGFSGSVQAAATGCWLVQVTGFDGAAKTINLAVFSLDIASDGGAVLTDLTASEKLRCSFVVS